MTDLAPLWLAALQNVLDRAAHELKDVLNGVHLNLEAIRSRSQREGAKPRDLANFAMSAADQLEALTDRTESVLFLGRPHRAMSGPADVALTLRHLATLLVPATRSDGGTLEVEGDGGTAPTSAPPIATRLALTDALLGLTKAGGEGGVCRCVLEAPGTGASAQETVVRFSHESADACSLDPAVERAIAEHQIRTQRSGSDLVLVFPGP